MNTSIYIKSVLAKIFDFSGLTNIYISNQSACNYLILMYHRVIKKKTTEPGMQEGMYVEPETFNMHIHYLKRYFTIIPLSEIISHLKDIPSKSKHPICILTFDDGWYDFYKFSYPILVEQKIPATLFLPTKFIGTRNRLWMDRVSNIFLQKDNKKYLKNINSISRNIIFEKLELLEGTTEFKIESAISILKNYKEDQVLSILIELENICGIKADFNERAFLNWEEVSKMAESGFINFGSHTNNHKILTHLSDNEIFEELMQSKSKLLSERIVNKSFIPFCYPNGNHDKRVVKMVEEAGYHLAVTTEKGWNNTSTHRFTLRRVGIHQDISSTKEMFGCRIANIF